MTVNKTGKREAMTKESWVKNVMRIYPAKTREETEQLYDKLFQNHKQPKRCKVV